MTGACDWGLFDRRYHVKRRRRVLGIILLAIGLTLISRMSVSEAQQQATPVQPATTPPRVTAARRFLELRGWPAASPRRTVRSDAEMRAGAPVRTLNSMQSPGRTEQPLNSNNNTAPWQPVGPAPIQSIRFGAISGRVTSLALDPADTTGNSLYLGTNAGGVWHSTNAAATDPTKVLFTPLTDNLSVLNGAIDASISMGAVSVQPGATGVILAGTGDSNDLLDSYYGAGILRSSNGGNTWSLSYQSSDFESHLSPRNYAFIGEGIAGFAWSTTNPQLVVVAVAQAYEGVLVNALLPPSSYEGLYFSQDAGMTWHLSTITDGASKIVQGPLTVMAGVDGNAATAVVWNPVRQLFIAAVRYHGYYQSSDGVTWTRLTSQPGIGLVARACPTNTGSAGNPNCPIWRGSLAVNPSSGDTFAWTVDQNVQDQGIWQDLCGISGGTCGNPGLTFATHLATGPLDTNTLAGPSTVVNGAYNLTLAAVPSQQDTLLFAGANDLWKCSLTMGCVWRNTTNALGCMSAAVPPYQNAVAWNPSNPLELLIGNDSGLWRSTDAIGETGSSCSASDAIHFQNLNSNLGSIAEVVSISQPPANPYTILAGLGVNGVAGVQSLAPPTPNQWPQMLDGLGGPVQIDPTNAAQWYVNNQAGVAISSCLGTVTPCGAGTFGQSPIITQADVDNDGIGMSSPAPFLVDSIDSGSLLVATCRVWRGPVNGVGWSNRNAISAILDRSSNSSCNGAALIRSISAQRIPGTHSEVIYVGMYGISNGGGNIAGHVFSATYDSNLGIITPWQDLTLNGVTNSSVQFNASGADVSSVVIDNHDPTGMTVYVTLASFKSTAVPYPQIYRSSDGGAHWTDIGSNLNLAPKNSVAVDPQSANIVYAALDTGVFFTTNIGSCSAPATNCWSRYGTGLPLSPVTDLGVTTQGAIYPTLTAATYGRGVWQIPLYSAGGVLTTATLSTSALTFGDQAVNSSSGSQSIVLKNTGSFPLLPTLITMSGDFTETDTCVNVPISPGNTCTILVVFAPTTLGPQTGSILLSSNVAGGQTTATLTGTGVAAGTISTAPPTLTFAPQAISTTSVVQSVTLNNNGGTSVSIQSIVATAPFKIASNVCGVSLGAGSGCAIEVTFTPTATGVANGTLTLIDSAGTQIVTLSGTGMGAATDTLSVSKLTFPKTQINTSSLPLTFTLTNSGDQTLNSISTSIGGDYQLTNSCGATLPGHTSCSFSVVFSPSVLGADSNALLIMDALTRSQTVALYGTGTTAPLISVNHPEGLSFPSTQQNTTSTSVQSLVIQNLGGSTMASPLLQLSGIAAASFVPVSPGNCGTPLAANGGQCSQAYAFRPAFVGPNQATLTLSSVTPGVAPVKISLSGTGIAPPALLVAPPHISFNGTALGSTSTSQITVENIGGSNFTDLQWAITSNPASFSISKTTCTPTLGYFSKQASIFCSIWVTYTATSTQVSTGTLTLSSASGVCPPVTVSLSGTGLSPTRIVSSDVQLDFGFEALNQPSNAQTLTITAAGALALTGLNLSLLNGPFSLAQNTCGTTLAANNSCTVQVLFNPTSTGYQTASLVISTTTSYVANASVLLTGTGLVPGTILALPAQLNFGSVLLNSPSVASTLTGTNTGAMSVTGLILQVPPSYSLTLNNCTATLAPGSSCTAGVVFTPTASGAINGSLNITSTSVGAMPVTVPLAGYGYTSGYAGVSPSTLNFGALYQNQSSSSQAVNILNTGANPLSGMAFALTGDFAITSQTCGTSLAKSASCLVNINFTPSTTGGLTGQLKVTSTTAGSSAVYVALSGTGQSRAALAASATQLNFSGTPVNAATPLTVTMTNNGTQAVSGLSISVTGPFTNSTCPPSLPAGANCLIVVNFNPLQQGPQTGVLTATSMVAGVLPVTVALSGTGTAAASLNLSSGTFNFSDIVLGAISAAQSMTISNPGAGPLSGLNLSLSGEPGDFQIVANNCPQTLLAGASCTASLVFAPTIAGGRAATLNVSSATTGVASVSAQLNGTGLSSSTLIASTSSLNFGALLTGQISAAQTVTLSAAGVVNFSAVSVSIDPGFVIVQNTCAGGIPSGGSCTLMVEFAPLVPVAYSGQLTVTATGAPYPVSVSLSGTGTTAPGLQSTPSQLSFQTTGVGQSSAPATVTITNVGTDSAVTGLTLTVSPLGSSFQIASTTCGATLAAASSCTAAVIFTPVTGGLAQASLVASGTNVPNSLMIPLQGVGLAFSLSVDKTQYTMASGQVATFNFTLHIPSPTSASLTPIQAVFSLSCAGLPANTACTFNPPCIPDVAGIGCAAASSNADGFATLMIQTGKKTLSNQRPADRPWEFSRNLLLACGMLVIPLGLYRSRRVLLLLVLLVGLTAGVTSCTSAKILGGGGGGGGGGSTPPGTSLIVVSATANGATQTATIQLTVD